MIRLLSTAATIAMLSGSAALAEAHSTSIVETAQANPDFSTLVTAVSTAGLVETLSGEGPFTVFAPVNDAFAALPQGTVESLLMEENREELTNVLTCHVVSGTVMSTDLVSMIEAGGGSAEVETLGGCVLTAAADGGTVTLTDETGRVVTVTAVDLEQTNGVIHVIDSVILPAAGADLEDDMSDDMASDDMASDDMASDDMASDDMASDDMASNDMASDDMASDDMASDDMASDDTMETDMASDTMGDTIVDVAMGNEAFSTLVTAVSTAGLVDTLKGDGPFTVFAPTNEAFAALPDGTVDSLLTDENRDQLTTILTAHVVAGDLSAADIVSGVGSDGFFHMTTVAGAPLSAQVTPAGSVFIFDESGNAYRVVTADVDASNGVIHVVEGVLLPR